MLKPYVSALIFAFTSRNKGKFLFPADYRIQQPCGSTLCFPCSVSVNVHRGTYIGVSEKLKPLWNNITAALPSGSDRLRKSTDRQNRPKGKASETDLGSCRSRADNSHAERNPLTETADRYRKTAVMVLPIIGGLHNLISVPAFG